MPKIKYDSVDLKFFKETEEGRKYLEYNDKVGGKPIGLTVPFGYPNGVEEMGGVIAVYDACIKQGITWEVLLDFHPSNEVII